MNKHHTKFKGDIGLTKAIMCLTELGYVVSIPFFEHQHYDIIVDLDNTIKRVQIKYSKDDYIKGATSYVNSNGESIYRNYKESDFELYLPNIDKCVFVPNVSGFTLINIRTKHPKMNNSLYYWWEDFLDPLIEKLPKKHQLKDFNILPKIIKRHDNYRKVKNRPTKEELNKLLNNNSYVKIGEIYGVSDNAIRKWAKTYNII